MKEVEGRGRCGKWNARCQAVQNLHFPSLLLNATPMELKINSLNSASAANAAYTYSGKISPKINDSLRDRDNKRETESGRGRER